MIRRTILSAGIGAAVLAAGGVAAFAQATQDHSAHSGHGAAGGIQYPKIAATAADCVLRGQECIDHCITVIKAGDISIADCMRSVGDLIVACNALRVMTISNAKDLPAFAKAVSLVCKTCEAECRKHAQHPPCKVCGESCAACADAIRATFT